MEVNPTIFEHAYQQLLYVLYSHDSNATPSFTTGEWEKEEGYKKTYWNEARKAMNLDSWSEHINDPMYIVRCGMQPFYVQMEDSSRLQNLVSVENFSKVGDIFLDNPVLSSKVLYSVFFGEDDKESFEQLAKLLSRKSMNDPLSAASLFFFLKNKDQYVTVRRKTISEQLAKLGINASCVQKCTWQGYSDYISVVHQIKDLLVKHIPETTLLDAHSFLWMLYKIEKTTPEYHASPLRRILFCNVAYMEHYDQLLFSDDKPMHGGSYVSDTGNAFESWNFHRCDDGKYYGFVETKYNGPTANEDYANQLHIEKIDINATGDSIENVTVIFCAKSDEAGGTVIVGWYKDATVFRSRKKNALGHSYNITASHAILLPPLLRTFSIQRSQKGIGFGQSNVWYAKDDAAEAIIKQTIEYISRFNDSLDIKNAANDALASLSDEELDKKIGITISEPAPTYSSISNLRKRNPYLPEKAKRRANGICQLCQERAPFTDKKGRPYLEAHHIIPLADDGPDTLENMVALCPNCHRKMHVLCRKEDIIALKGKAGQLA